MPPPTTHINVLDFVLVLQRRRPRLHRTLAGRVELGDNQPRRVLRRQAAQRLRRRRVCGPGGCDDGVAAGEKLLD